MKALWLLPLLMASAVALAEESSDNGWNATSLGDEVIQKIQQAQFSYKKCVVDAMQKPEAAQLESRRATDAIARQCEPVLGEMRKVYLDHNVPGVIADRHLKKLRIEITRKMLQELMFQEAARASGSVAAPAAKPE